MLTNYQRRKYRVRNGIVKNNRSSRPRLVVFRSNKNTYAQLIDDNGLVLKSFSTLNLEKGKKANGIEKAKLVGQGLANACLSSSIKNVVFDRGAFSYQGRIKALAEACRQAGLEF
jgi:large subunit ribosomal protein L18